VVLTALQDAGLVRQRSISAESVIRLLLVFIGAHYLAMLGLGYFVATK
jgi:hypothetical protein